MRLVHFCQIARKAHISCFVLLDRRQIRISVHTIDLAYLKNRLRCIVQSW